MAKQPPSRDFLIRAYKQLRKSHWGTFEQSLSDPIRGKIITALARSLQGITPPPAAENLPKLAGKSTLPDLPPGLDLKRRASGERDDD